MADTGRRRRERVPAQTPRDPWSRFTWDDLVQWAGAGAVSRGRSYQRRGRVEHLCVSETGTLLARVHGGDRYAVRVDLDPGKRARADRITSLCTCPVRLGCKHAVAVVTEYLHAIEAGTDVPVMADDDRRLPLVEGRLDRIDDDDPPGEVPGARPRTRRISDRDIRDHLASRSHEELVDLILSVCGRDPDVRKSLVDACALAGGRYEALIAEARSELQSVTAEEAWQNGWTGAGHLPDYTRLEERLKALLEHGHADAVLQLGEELLERGTDQVEQSHDEGETAWAIGDCMAVVCDALLRSSHRDEDKLLRAIDLLIDDGYDMCRAFEAVTDRRWKRSTWSVVADRLWARLGDCNACTRDDWAGRHRRRQMADRVVQALDKAGRTAEATEACVAEARATGSHPRAVRRLIDVGDDDRAASLAREGITAADPHEVGVVRELQDLLCEMADRAGDPMLPAAVAADRFFDRPTLEGYRTLLEAADTAGHEESVRRAALAFLEGGSRPDRARSGRASRTATSDWPLSEPPRPTAPTDGRGADRTGPYFDVLIDLAIDEQRPDDVLSWFDKRSASVPTNGPRWAPRIRCDEERVARAIEETHPERAIGIYMERAHDLVARTDPRDYPEAGACLQRVNVLLKASGRLKDWPALLEGFRGAHRRKRRLMEVLDGIDGRPIVNHRRR